MDANAYDVVVIGGGAAGLTAALVLRILAGDEPNEYADDPSNIVALPLRDVTPTAVEANP